MDDIKGHFGSSKQEARIGKNGGTLTVMSRKVSAEPTSQHMSTGVRPSFNRFGQHEPATVRIKNIITQYVGDRDGCGVEELVKELMQNSDDAKATEIHFVLDKRSLPTSRVWDEWKTMQGPALCIQNNSVFTQTDIESIQKLGVGSKANDPDKTGQFGIGFNVVYQLTDCPILLSDHKDVCMFDPHLRYVPGACDERPGGHVDLRQDTNFAKLFPDFMAGFLRNHVEHSGSTVFRFPLRQRNVKSEICDMSFNSADVAAMEEAFQSVDFRMFVHSALLFTKHLQQVKVSVMDSSGKLQEKVNVRRIIPSAKQEQLQAAHKRLSHEMKLVMTQKFQAQDVTKCSISYHLTTEDEFLKNEWFVNQTFGFYGNNMNDEREFLEKFFSEQSKKFLPTAGVATKLNSSNILVSLIYAFLPLPIRTGLPVHLNGHFAIHSSRRSVWEHTSFGQWNRIMRLHILAPSYCHFLLDLAKTVKNDDKMKQWLKMVPDVGKVTDDFVKSLVLRIYDYATEQKLPIIPVTREDKSYRFLPHSDCLFTTSDRNAVVEQLLMRLEQNVCLYPEIGLRFHKAGVMSLSYISPVTVLDRLKALNLRTQVLISASAFGNVETIAAIVDYILVNHTKDSYNSLDKSPLCLTIDGFLRNFSVRRPVFIESHYATIIPAHPELFLHKAISSNIQHSSELPTLLPIANLKCKNVGDLVKKNGRLPDVKWVQTVWKFIKAVTRASEVKVHLAPMLHLPLLPLTNGNIVTLKEGENYLSTAEASKNVQRVVKKMGLVQLNADVIATTEVTNKDISALATPFMLNAALPGAFIQALRQGQITNHHLEPEDCEILLQYFSLDAQLFQSDTAACKTVRRLPIYEDIDGTYKCISDLQGVVLDNCIPTFGISTWMEQSNCLLLKEKVAYSELYVAVGLVKKNAVEVYLDDIFPNFSDFDEELRMSHLTSIRSSVLPLLEAYADKETQDKFWTRLKDLAMIPVKGQLFPARVFRDPEVEVLTLLDDLQPLPLLFTDNAWLDFLRKAGLQSDLSDDQLLTCAEHVSRLTTAQFSEQKAQQVLEWADSHTYTDEVLSKLCDIRFIPQELVPVDSHLLEFAPPVVPMYEYISLRSCLIYENDKDRHIFRHCILCWTVDKCLPKWVKLSQKLAQIAEVKFQPSVKSVCSHIMKLSDKLISAPTSTTFKSFRKVINYCLDYLQNPCKCNKKRCEDCASLRQLRNVPFVCVKARLKRVAPSQIILHLPSDIDADVLYPYVFSRPADMAKHDELLRRIGSMMSPTPDLYAEILHSLWLDFGSKQPLQTNDKQTASLAVYGLFTSLQQQGQRLTTHPLCLPTDKAIMSLSTELVVADNELLAKNVREKSYDYMCSLNSCNLAKNAKELLFYLPENVRPKLLSELVTEDVSVGEPCDLDLCCPFYKCYYERFHSKKFSQAVWLIARIPEEKREEFSNELGRLKLVEITCFLQMTGFLSENGRTIESSRADKNVHVHNTIATAHLYLRHYNEYPGPAGFVNEVASALKAIICYKESYYLDTGAIVHLLKCETDDDIEQYLIEEGLYSKEDDMSRPKTGTIVPLEGQELFTYDPEMIFQPKEYVGFAKADSDCMMYAKIIRESAKTEGQEMKALLREYDVDIGCGYPVQAQATDLFRETRRQNLDQYKQLVVSDSQTKVPANLPAQKATIAEAQRTITRLLEEVFSDPSLWRQREKVKKRLMLKWHPDKAGNSSLTHEVFKHLMMEIERVEIKYSLSDDEDDENTETEVYEWEETVETINVKKEKLQQIVPGEKGDWLAAQKWLKQAVADLKSAKFLVESSTGYEWACHICCEIVRKMLVASIIAKSKLTSDLESTRFTSKLYDAVSRLKGHPTDLPVKLLVFSKLKVDETTTRQPGLHHGQLIPANVFDKEIAVSILQTTESIMDQLRRFIDNDSPADLQVNGSQS